MDEGVQDGGDDEGGGAEVRGEGAEGGEGAAGAARDGG